ncbi:hypothetical protein [Lacinutrix sp. MedPE-SW]|uniref:hypothetical protein n=1 Tax=Lacinutrix sp. MedPE-SW TaxID=1860087 RepID=UPI00091AF066|nr:hypothetical protein [Lacinutrix sp. MedPE-SW]OIQ23172.1 MAG: hypothetical protein BM549_03920 [Lacinutrix sp. MedPE-SW]
MKKTTLLFIALATGFLSFSQETEEQTESNIQTYTPSKLLNKGQWDIKFFNSLYTQTKQTDAGSDAQDILRENFFTNTTEIYTGVSNNSRINVGLILQVRANTFNGQDAFSVFSFENNGIDSRSGLTTIAPSIRVQPFANIPNFSFTSSVYLPIFKDEPGARYLDKRSVFWETKFFYDKTFGGGDWQIFTEADFGFNFGEKASEANPEEVNIGERFANNSMFLPVSAFLSYFPSGKSTVFVNAQQAFLIDLGNDFSQNYTQLGFGGKYQLSQTLNIEASYGKIVRGHSFQGLGNTYSLGLRALF